jgi:hypothetical protein
MNKLPRRGEVGFLQQIVRIQTSSQAAIEAKIDDPPEPLPEHREQRAQRIQIAGPQPLVEMIDSVVGKTHVRFSLPAPALNCGFVSMFPAQPSLYAQQRFSSKMTRPSMPAALAKE